MAQKITDGKYSFTPTDGCKECEKISEKIKTKGLLIVVAFECCNCGTRSTNWNKPGYVDNPVRSE